jgi:N-acetylglutamate synthase
MVTPLSGNDYSLELISEISLSAERSETSLSISVGDPSQFDPRFASLRMTFTEWAFRMLLAKMKADADKMDREIQTRDFSIADYEAVLQLWQRVEGLEVAEGDDKEGVDRFVTRNPGLSKVAIDGAKLVGVAMCGHDGRRGHIYHVAVDPGYRRYGLGKRLVQECLDGLRRVGIMRVIILVADYNVGGAEFWKRAGWEDIPGAVPMGIDA